MARGNHPIGFSPIVPIVIVVGGVVAMGLLVAAHPVTGAVLIVGVVVLALLFGRAPVATREEPPPPE